MQKFHKRYKDALNQPKGIKILQNTELKFIIFSSDTITKKYSIIKIKYKLEVNCIHLLIEQPNAGNNKDILNM